MKTNEENNPKFSINIVNNRTVEIVFKETILNLNLTESRDIETVYIDNELMKLKKSRLIRLTIEAECK
jgi:hypothetical protein